MTSADAREAAASWWSRMQGPEAGALRAEFEAWRAASPLHASEYAAIEKTWSLSSGLASTGMGRARALPPRPRPLAWATAPRLAMAAAAMVVAVLLVTLWPSAPSVLQPIAVAHATGVGEIRTLTLPDGSTVTMDTDTRLEVRFDGKTRLVTLESGRARFEVKSDPARSFLVASGGRIVSANGAGFDVQLAPTGLCVQPLRGGIEVRPDAAGTTRPVLRLTPGRIVRFAASGAPEAEPAGKGSERWVEGMLVFQGAPLSAVLAETNRYASRPILLGDPSLGALRVTGTFRPVPTDKLAASLAAAFGLEIERNAAGAITLVRKDQSQASDSR